MTPEAGRRFGPYEIQARLGGGGMGHVYRAWDARLHREVALKLLQSEYAMPGMRERFLREARAASALNHQNICTIFDIGEQDGDPYLVMELLQGETLKSRIERSTIQVDDLVCIAREVAEALGAAHSKGVVHRDIKPANIFLSDKQNGKIQAKVLDFGLAKFEEGSLGARGRHLDITTVGSTVGTLAYMSPEQARGETLDSRSDLFSLGVVLYEMATRHVPFSGATSALVFVKLLNHPPEPVRDWNDAVPRELEKIIDKLMAKERTARFQTAAELDEALARLNEKPQSGGWLRKAVATVPLVRAADPVARQKKLPRRRGLDSGTEPARELPTEPQQATDLLNGLANGLTSRPGAGVGSSEQVLRPVARVPREDATPRPSAELNRLLAARGRASGAGTPLATGGERFSPEPPPLDPQLPGQSGGTFFPPLQPRSAEAARAPLGTDRATALESAPSMAAANAAMLPAIGPRERPSGAAVPAIPVPAIPIPAIPVQGQTHVVVPAAELNREVAATTPARSVTEQAPAGSSVGTTMEPEQGGAVRQERETHIETDRDDEALDLSPETRPLSRPPRSASRSRRRMRTVWLIGSIVVLAVLISALLLYVDRGHLRPTMLTEQDPVVLTEVVNNTGDKTLDGSVALGLQMALAQSPYLKLATGDDYRSALRLTGVEPGDPVSAIHARSAAQRLGAKAYLLGRVSGSGAPYTLHLDLLSAETNDVMASVEEHSASLEELPGAIDRLSDSIRAAAGEDADSINLTHVPLAREATADLDALHAFATGEDAQIRGHVLEALAAYQQAVTLEPKFTEAHLRLVVLYRNQRAEVAAADASRMALAGAEGTAERTRTLAQYEYEMNASGDYGRATALIRHLLTVLPHDAVVLADLARVLRLQGRMSEALQTAQQASMEDPYNMEAYVQAENALISLDRYDAALQIEEQVQHLDLARVGGSLTAAYLEGRQEVVDQAVTDYQSRTPGQRADWNFGLYLDNSGKLSTGLALWRSNAEAQLAVTGLSSGASYLLSQAALDRAILGDCANALELGRESASHPQGTVALFNTGISAALCGDPATAQKVVDVLTRDYPQSTDVNEYLLPDLKAAIVLQADDPESALEILKPTRQYDLISLTPFLRGRAHVALRQVQVGIVDFQTVLSHRGITFITGTDVYPMAEIGVARAFADTGDRGNSADAYRRFLELWRNADPNQRLLLEARSKTAAAAK